MIGDGNKVRVGIIGCGIISEAHLYAYSQCDDVDLVAVADINEKLANVQAEKYHTKYYLDYSEMLDNEKLDGVSICVPQFLHKRIGIDCLKLHINVLCEKPLAISVEEAEEMTIVAEEANVILMTAFCFRFHPPIVEIKKYISEGKLGRILMFRLRFGKYKNKTGQWISKIKMGGGVLTDESVHAIDLFRYLAGDIKNVSGRTSTFVNGMEAEDSVIILLESDKGTTGVIEDSWATPHSVNGIEIYGKRGLAQTDFSKVTFEINGNVEQLEFKDDKDWLHSKRFKNEINHFLNCIKKSEKPKVAGEDGLKAIQIVEAVRDSVKDKKWVELIK